ncbi:Exosome complex component Rrp4 [uncultured archaeon]|nr:Exosome complex component Rrp4 [uncultured archaeon]
MPRIVLPGDKLADKPLRIDNATLEDGKSYATVPGLFDDEKESFIPLESVWYPRMEDSVIGIVEDARNGVYTVALNSPFKGLIITRRDSNGPELEVGDVVESIVRSVKRESDKIILILVRPRNLHEGKVITVKPSKVLRIIGKANTMIKLLTEGTKSNIVVGMNGIVWIKGGNVPLAVTAINRIQAEAHVAGLTERITTMLKESQ